MDLNEEASISLRVEGKEFANELDRLETKAKELNTQLKEVEKTVGKGSDEWKQVKQEAKAASDAVNDHRKTVDNTQLTYTQLQTQVRKLDAEMRKLKPGTDEWIAAVKKSDAAKKQLELVNKEIDDIKKANENAEKSALKMASNSALTYTDLKKKVELLRVEMSTLKPKSDEFVAATKKLAETEKYLKDVEKEVKAVGDALENPEKKGLWAKMSSGANLVKTAMAAFMALEVVQTVIGWGKAVFDTTAKFESYEKSLAATFQATMSQADAQKAAASSMKALAVIARETPLTLDEVTKGYVSLANRGLKPGEEQMKRMIDVSTKARLPLDQLGEAIKDVNNNERWSEFGIKVKTSGDKITTSVAGVTKSFERSEQGAMDMVVELGKVPGTLNFAGQSMDSLNGKASNVDDTMDALKLTVGQGLAPVFLFFLSAIQKGISWLIDLMQASDPVVKVFEDMYVIVADLAESLMNYVDSILPDFVKGGISLDTVMKVVGFAFRAVLTPVQAGVGALRLFYDAMAGVVEGAKGLYKAFTGDLVGAAESFEKSKVNFTNVGTHAVDTYDKIKKGWTDAFVDQPKKDSDKAALASQTAEEKRQNQILAAQRKAQAQQEEDQKKSNKKQEQESKKQQNKEIKNHEKHLQDVEKANEDALKKLRDLEDEQFVARIKDAETRDIVRLQQKAERALNANQESLANDTLKASQEKLIQDQLQTDIAKVQADYREKKEKADEDAANKAKEVNAFVRQQESQAIAVYYDFLETTAKGNGTRLAAIKKERLGEELRLLKEKLTQEEAAEIAKANKEITNKEVLDTTLADIRNRFINEDLLAEQKSAAAKKQIDDDLHKAKVEKLQTYSSMFASLLKGDVSSFLEGAQTMVKGHQEAWQKKLSADMSSFQMGADMAQQAVSFLNNLAQAKADKAIAAASRERDEKVAILTNELTVTESLITSSSNYVQALKTAETNRLTELQQILTSETTTEEQKRDALKKYYSEQLQQMKTAEENKIMELQRLANLAKTDDEKRAIEAKIQLAKKESAEKIRLADEEAASKMKTLNELQDFSIDSSNTLLKDAEKASEKQITIASDEAEQKADFKADLEETIAAENRKARATEQAEKTKAFKAQKKADIATALITGALAVLKALANFFPLNIILAATAAVVTGVQIAKIKNQPDPQFSRGAHGYFSGAGYLKGGKHGPEYGTGGIAFVDRKSGREVGEAEDGEAYIMSNEITKHHKPVLDQIIYQSLNRKPGPLMMPKGSISMRDGGVGRGVDFSNKVPTTPYWQKNLMLFGSKKRKAEQAAKDAEAEAAAAQAEADQAMADSGVDTSAYNGVNANDPSATGDTASANAAHAKAEKMGEEQLESIQGIEENTGLALTSIKELTDAVNSVKSSVDSVKQAVNGVEGAVNASNQSGRMDVLIGAVSLMGGK